MDKQSLMVKTVVELKLIAKKMQLERYSALKKADLIAYILSKQRQASRSPKRVSPSSPKRSINFPILYDRQSNNKRRQWHVKVVDNAVITEYGQVDGKLTIATVIVKGKNIGKANETTPHQQAVNTAQSKWTKKVDEGYVEKMSSVSVKQSPKRKQTSGAEVAKILPMLALQYEKRGHNIEFPCYVQPKIDGVRAIYYNDQLWSRLGNQFMYLDHLSKEIQLMAPDLNLDGELYTDAYPFEKLVGLLKKKKNLTAENIKDLTKVKYIVYDYVSDLDYDKRYKTLKQVFSTAPRQNVVLLKTRVCNSAADIPVFLSDYIADGYEGLIIRNMKGPYKTKYRSKDLQKLKTFQDAEFKIVDYTDGQGKERGLIIFICETKTHDQFNVRPRGTAEEREDMYSRANSFIGKFLTVRFQDYTAHGIPRFPVGITTRDYE
jgi:DNA ligase-1